MTLPQFTAEASLRPTNASYSQIGTAYGTDTAGVRPAAYLTVTNFLGCFGDLGCFTLVQHLVPPVLTPVFQPTKDLGGG